jgi:hypothetical protein
VLKPGPDLNPLGAERNPEGPADLNPPDGADRKPPPP